MVKKRPGLRVLVVDDNHLIRWLLTLYGFEIPRPTSQDNPAPANGVPFAAAE